MSNSALRHSAPFPASAFFKFSYDVGKQRAQNANPNRLEGYYTPYGAYMYSLSENKLRFVHKRAPWGMLGLLRPTQSIPVYSVSIHP